MLSCVDHFVESNLNTSESSVIIDLIIRYWRNTCFNSTLIPKPEDDDYISHLPIIPKAVSTIIEQYIDKQIGVLSNSDMSCNINWKIQSTAKFLKYTIGKSIESDKFECAKLQWHLKIYPNGGNRKSLGLSNLYLYLDRFPSNIKQMTIHYSLRCKETDSCFKPIATLKENDLCGGWSNRCQLLSEFKDLSESMMLDEINFECSINILRIIGNHEQVIYHYPITIDHTKPYNFSWIIDQELMQLFKNSYHGKRFASPTSDNQMWCLRCYPNGRSKEQKGNVRLYLQLCSLPMGISKLKARFQLVCYSTNTQFEDKQFFSYDNNSTKNGLPTNKLLMEQFNDIKECVFTAHIDIIEMYDMDNQLIYTNDTQDQDWMKYILRQASSTPSGEHPPVFGNVVGGGGSTTDNTPVSTSISNINNNNGNYSSTLGLKNNGSGGILNLTNIPLPVVSTPSSTFGEDDGVQGLMHNHTEPSSTMLNGLQDNKELKEDFSIDNQTSDFIEALSNNSSIHPPLPVVNNISTNTIINHTTAILNTTASNTSLASNPNNIINHMSVGGVHNLPMDKIKFQYQPSKVSNSKCSKSKVRVSFLGQLPKNSKISGLPSDIIYQNSDVNDSGTGDMNDNENRSDIQHINIQISTNMEHHMKDLALGVKNLTTAVQNIHSSMLQYVQTQQRVMDEYKLQHFQEHRYSFEHHKRTASKPVLVSNNNKSVGHGSTTNVNQQRRRKNRSLSKTEIPVKNILKKQNSIENDIQTSENENGLNHKRNNDISVLQLWLENDVGLPEYFDAFVENGIENLEVVKNLTDSHLKDELAIEKIGHRILLQKEILKLRTTFQFRSEKTRTSIR